MKNDGMTFIKKFEEIKHIPIQIGVRPNQHALLLRSKNLSKVKEIQNPALDAAEIGSRSKYTRANSGA